MSLEQLKAKHEQLLFTDKTMCEMISVEMEAYSKMFHKLDLRDFNEQQVIEAYQRAISALESKAEHNTLIIAAYKSGESLSKFDLFENDGRVKDYYKRDF